MIVKEQKPITLINKAKAIFDAQLLIDAILWHAHMFYGRPVARLKSVFLWGKYPAVAIHNTKIHIHRLLYAFYHHRVFLTDNYIHHRDNNKLNANIKNLQLMKASEHQSITNKGRKFTAIHRKRIGDGNRRRAKRIYESPELLKS